MAKLRDKTPHFASDAPSRNKVFVLLLSVCVLQSCRLYLVGTKQDLVANSKSARKVDHADLQSYADGQSVLFSCMFCLALMHLVLKRSAWAVSPGYD